MTTLNLFQSLDMTKLGVDSPTITEATASQITTRDGAATGRYFGNFSFAGGSLSGGTITGYERIVAGVKTHEVSGASFSAITVASYIANRDGQGLLTYILSGADTINGSTGNDILKGFAGNDSINGGQGTDTVVFSGSRASYTVTNTASGFTVKHNSGSEGTDALTNIERIRFSDASVAFDTAGNGGQAYRLYQAAFNRTPDQGGLGFQMKALDDGFSLAQVAQNFINSPEFSATYGSLNTTQFVTQLYQNVLHRAPDAGGLAFHTGNLEGGVNSRAQVLVGFSESPENQAALIGIIQNGMAFTL